MGITVYMNNADIYNKLKTYLKDNLDKKASSSIVSTLKETSYDDCKKIYMTESLVKVINFDTIKKIYSKNIGKLHDTPCSNDAILLDNKNNIIFIEFRNGTISKLDCFTLKKKIYDSMLIMNDITKVSISYSRHNMIYILVYNNEVNLKTKDEQLLAKQNDKKAVSSSYEYKAIVKQFSKYSKEEYVCFGLNIFKNYIFKEVHTYDKDEFNQYINTLN